MATIGCIAGVLTIAQIRGQRAKQNWQLRRGLLGFLMGLMGIWHRTCLRRLTVGLRLVGEGFPGSKECGWMDHELSMRFREGLSTRRIMWDIWHVDF